MNSYEPTEKHQSPTQVRGPVGFPALIVVFPILRAIALKTMTRGEVLGRDWLNQYGLLDKQVSTKHFELQGKGARYQITDAHSTNGTWVNGDKLVPGQPYLLQDLDVVRVGNTLMVFRSQLEGSLEPSPPVTVAEGKTIVAPFGMRRIERFVTELGKIQVTRADGKIHSVLLQGETGTGKEALARWIHETVRPGKKYCAVNVAAIPASVFDSHMFGHVKGAFTGASTGNRGVFASCGGGTVFIDEVGEIPVEVQPKLLRLLEEREIQPVGSTRTQLVDVFIVAATNRRLDDMVGEGRFREDLLARFAFPLEIPPLRQRREDILAIVWEQARLEGVDVGPNDVTVEAAEQILLHDWPENVRGLIRLLARGRMEAPQDPLALHVVKAFVKRHRGNQQPIRTGQKPKPEDARRALERAEGNKSRAAQLLGISRQAFYRLLEKQAGPST